MIIITGGAGFIGSVLLWALNERGHRDIVIVDELDHEEKERNVGHLHYEQLVGIDEFLQQVKRGEWDDRGVEQFYHLGACSDTTETNWEYLERNNVQYTQELIRWCVDRSIRCVYASSAATYGDGAQGFSDNHDLFDELQPLNLYGKSKLQVDVWARDAGYLDEVVGLRYFNVFGPNENHKEHMRSVIAKKFPTLRDSGYIELFASAHPDYADGEQQRDFLYVLDAVDMTIYCMETPAVAGVYNIGSGKANTWNEMAKAMFAAVDRPADIRYIDMPSALVDQYQYFTQAEMGKLTATGYKKALRPLAEAIDEYITGYLLRDRHMGEA